MNYAFNATTPRLHDMQRAALRNPAIPSSAPPRVDEVLMR
jgi:hypothetical protein